MRDLRSLRTRYGFEVVRARKLELFCGRQNLAKSLDVALERAAQLLA